MNNPTRMNEWRFQMLKSFVRRPDFFKAPHENLSEYPCLGTLCNMLDQEIEDAAAHVARELTADCDLMALTKAQGRLQLLIAFAHHASGYCTDEFEKALRDE